MNDCTPLLDALLQRLSAHCENRRGRKAELAAHLGVRPHMISAWLAREKSPGGEYTLAIQAWLAEEESEVASAED